VDIPLVQLRVQHLTMLTVAVLCAFLPNRFAFASGVAPCDSFKAFISNPPYIKDLVFSLELLPSTEFMEPGIKRAGVQHFYQAKWQPGAVFLRELQAANLADSVVTPGELISIFGETYWFRDEGRRNIDQWVDKGPLSNDQDNYVVRATAFRSNPLWEVMSLGILHLKPGLIRWRGDEFSIRTVDENEDFLIHGRLVCSISTGVPDRMQVSYLRRGRTNDFVLRYGFQPGSIGAVIPMYITNSWVHDGREFPHTIYHVDSVVLSQKVAERSAFDPSIFILTNGWSVRFYSNFSLYAEMPAGEVRFLESLWRQEHGLPKEGTRNNPRRRHICYFAIALANCGFLVFASKAWRGDGEPCLQKHTKIQNPNEN
jgi:hypothetical protein